MGIKLFDEIGRLRRLEKRMDDCPSIYAKGLAESELSAIEQHLASLGLEPQLPYLEERAFYVMHGARAVEEMLDVMASDDFEILVPEYVGYYHAEELPLTASGLLEVMMQLSTNSCTPYEAARLHFILHTEEWNYLSRDQADDKWNLINLLLRNDIDPYRNPVRDTLIKKYATSVRRYADVIETGKPAEKDEAIRCLGGLGIIETRPEVLRHVLNPDSTETEPTLTQRDYYLMAANPDWKDIAGSLYWGNQADERPNQTKLSVQRAQSIIMKNNRNWKEIALNRTLAQYVQRISRK